MKPSVRLILLWLGVTLPLLGITSFLGRMTEGDRVWGFAPLFPGYRQLWCHDINRPKGKEKLIVVLGSSTMAGWGCDQRGAYMDFRHRHDIWGRAALSFHIEKYFSRQGQRVRVANLGINYGAIWADLAVLLKVMKQQPDLILHGPTTGSFWGTELKIFPEIGREIPLRLAAFDYPDKEALEKPLMETLAARYREVRESPALPRTAPKGWVLWLGNAMTSACRAIGLPPLVSKPGDYARQESSMREAFAAPLAAYAKPCLINATNTLAAIPVVMHRVAKSQGAAYVLVSPPTLYQADQRFYRESLLPQYQRQGVPVIDLCDMDLPYGVDSYDGLHFTPSGAAKMAEVLCRRIAPLLMQ
ncbi:MAG: hypothetical protein PHV34_08550 [Verrucomicrobiae bacterium]|nr:hypothetical protein [Verrucomicrobiae bacterium]